MKTCLINLLGIILILASVLPGCKKKSDDTQAVQGQLPVVETTNVSVITDTSVWCNGNVTNEGSSRVIAKGICVSSSPGPDINSNHMAVGFGSGTFLGYARSLQPNTFYYVRAYASNSSGTSYGGQLTFTTTHIGKKCTVITLDAGGLTNCGITFKGNVSDSGGSRVTERGICWSTENSSPDTTMNRIRCGSGPGAFSERLMYLDRSLTYYCRAYAINGAGISYGNYKQAIPHGVPRLGVPGNYQGWNYSDTVNVLASTLINDLYEGYLWLPANSSIKYSKGNPAEVWGDNSGDGKLELGGSAILIADEGYYKLDADFPYMTHSFLKTTWSIMGDATPGGFITDTDMTYMASEKIWSVTADLVAGGFTFRANHRWELSYGDNGAHNGQLESGGLSIQISLPGNYTISLDFNQPYYHYQVVKN